MLATTAAASVQIQFAELTPRLPRVMDGTWAVAVGDVDGDGDNDIVSANGLAFGAQNRLYSNNGAGMFTDVTPARMPRDVDYTRAVALGDVDGDGDLDMVLANWHQNRLYLNNGVGWFIDVTTTSMPVMDDNTWAVALGDVDGDGDNDIVFGGISVVPLPERNRLYLNDGAGRFIDATVGRLPTFRRTTYAVALGDVDGDGDNDIIFGTEEDDENQLYLNDGAGHFANATATHMPPGLVYGDRTYAVALGDMDGDGDLDLVSGNGFTGVAGCSNAIYVNDGTGRFTKSYTALSPNCRSTWSVVLDDVDGDLDLDLVFGNEAWYGRSQDRLYINDGAGQFKEAAGRLPRHRNASLGLAIGDVDGDGDPDLVIGTAISSYGGSAQNRLYLNLLRQLDAPLLAKPGLQYQLDVYARYGPQRLLDVGVPYVSSGTAQVPLPPMGTFGLDPTQMVALPPLIIPQPAGVGSVSFIMPNLPGLVGATVYAQALLVQYPALARLTNVTVDVILR